MYTQKRGINRKICVFFMSCVNFAQSKQEKFNIPNPPEYPPELFNFSIKRFRRRISTPVVKIMIVYPKVCKFYLFSLLQIYSF